MHRGIVVTPRTVSSSYTKRTSWLSTQAARVTSIREAVASGTLAAAQDNINVQGWVSSVRLHKQTSFVALSDGSWPHSLQLVAPTSMVKPLVDKGLSTGASVSAVGTLGMTRVGQRELVVRNLELVGASSADFPLQKKYHTPEYMREHTHLRARTPLFAAVLRARSQAASSLRATLEGDGLTWISTPILTQNDCEGAGEVFHVSAPGKPDFFSSCSPTFLTVSGQLHLEMFACGLSKTYTFGPTFRAEDSNTTRHLAEFWMLEPELAFASWRDAAALASRCVAATAEAMLGRADDVALFVEHAGQHRGGATSDEGGLEHRLKRAAALNQFAYMSYFDAVAVLDRHGLAPPARAPLAAAHERFLVEKHCQGTPLIVHDYPREIKPFYVLANDDGAQNTAAAFDLLVSGIGELVGGSARESRFDVLRQRMETDGLLPKLKWYLDLREFGTVPHAGFGMGFDRLVQFLTGLDNIRDAVPVARFPGGMQY